MNVTKNNFKEEVLNSKEKVLVNFWATWCSPCNLMSPIMETLSEDFKVVKINVDEEKELAARYAIAAIPAFLIFQSGEIIERKLGLVSEKELREKM